MSHIILEQEDCSQQLKPSDSSRKKNGPEIFP